MQTVSFCKCEGDDILLYRQLRYISFTSKSLFPGILSCTHPSSHLWELLLPPVHRVDSGQEICTTRWPLFPAVVDWPRTEMQSQLGRSFLGHLDSDPGEWPPVCMWEAPWTGLRIYGCGAARLPPIRRAQGAHLQRGREPDVQSEVRVAKGKAAREGDGAAHFWWLWGSWFQSLASLSAHPVLGICEVTCIL